MTRYNPVCETCHSRPKMDRCDCCEECWYSGRWSEQQRLRRMTPAERAQERWLYSSAPGFCGVAGI